MKNWSDEVKLGVFIVMALAALFYLTFSIGGKKMLNFGKVERTLVVYFDHITGVSEKSDVRMAGVKIGEVGRIELDNYRAKVIVELFGDYSIPEDSTATVEGKGLLGEKFIEIRAGSSTKYISNGGKLTKSVSPANIDDMVAKLSDALDDVKKVTSSLSQSFGTEEGKEGLKSIIKNLSELSRSLNVVVGNNRDKLNEIIDNVDKSTKILMAMLSENRENLKGTMSNFNTMSKALSEKTPDLLDNLEKASAGIKEMINENRSNVKDSMANIKEASGNFNGVLVENRENFKVAMENLKKSSEKLDQVLASVRQITGKLEKGEGTMGKLIQDEEIYAGLNETLEGTKSLAKQAGALKISLGARDEYLGSSVYTQNTRSYFSVGIKPREDKYYMLELTNDVRRAGSAGVSKGSLSSILYTFYIAKRFGNATFRGGLMESSGGVGMDVHAWNDKLKLSVDAFNLSGYDQYATAPQIKVTGTFYPQKYLYLYLGGDELANQYYRTFFVGVGLMADEDDFKMFLARMF